VRWPLRDFPGVPTYSKGAYKLHPSAVIENRDRRRDYRAEARQPMKVFLHADKTTNSLRRAAEEACGQVYREKTAYRKTQTKSQGR